MKVKRTEDDPSAETRTDGGSGQFDWRGETATQISRWDRYKEIYEERIYKPALVAWDDSRTRWGSLILLFYVVIALVALFGLWRYPATSQAARWMQPWPWGSLAYPLGTTKSGTDLAALLIHSTPYILILVTAGAIWATGIAVFVGTVSGYKGGTVDSVLMSISDFFMAIPGLPLVIVLAVAFSPENPVFVGVIITINYWAGLGRSLRSQVLTIRENNYVEAARTMGTSTPRIIFKDVLPNLMPYVTVNAVFAARYTIFASVGLYFLGVLPYKIQNWGVTLNLAYNSAALFNVEYAYYLIIPMLAIMLLSFGFILLGQGLDRVFNPRVRTRMAGETESTVEDDDEDTGFTEVM